MRLPLSLSLLLAVVIGAATAAAVEEKPTDTAAVTGGQTDAIREEMEAAGKGDNEKFTISTDADLRQVEKGDIYRNDQRTFFRVEESDKTIRENKVKHKLTGTELASWKSGGKLVLMRIYGTNEPGNRFHRVQGLGPQIIDRRMTLLDLYGQGGGALHPIACLALFTILLSANCIWLYRRRRQIAPRLEREGLDLLKRGDFDALAAIADSSRGLFAVVCRAMTERWESSSLAEIKERVPVAAAVYINRLRWPAKLLNLIAVAAPLLGLLGTIIGMVIVFEGVAGSTGAAKASILAAGIRVKLFSTAFALFVAIPSLFLFFMFNQRVNTMIGECEQLTVRFLQVITRLKRGKPVEGGDDEEDDDEAPPEAGDTEV